MARSKTNLKPTCEDLMLRFVKGSVSLLLGPETSRHTMRCVLLQLSAFVSYTDSYRLQSILEVNVFLFPSERRDAGLFIMVSPGLVPDREPRKTIC